MKVDSHCVDSVTAYSGIHHVIILRVYCNGINTPVMPGISISGQSSLRCRFLRMDLEKSYHPSSVARLSVTGIQESSVAFNLYRPPISVLAYAIPSELGWKTIPVVKPPEAPVRTFCQSSAACPEATDMANSEKERKAIVAMSFKDGIEVKTVVPKKAALQGKKKERSG